MPALSQTVRDEVFCEVTKGPSVAPPCSSDSRQRVLLPHLPGLQGLVDGLVFALGSVLPSSAALHHTTELQLLVPGPRQDVVSLTIPVHHHTRHLQKMAKGSTGMSSGWQCTPHFIFTSVIPFIKTSFKNKN